MRLAVIFAAMHFLIVGLAILESGGTEEGLTAVVIGDAIDWIRTLIARPRDEL